MYISCVSHDMFAYILSRKDLNTFVLILSLQYFIYLYIYLTLHVNQMITFLYYTSIYVTFIALIIF